MILSKTDIILYLRKQKQKLNRKLENPLSNGFQRVSQFIAIFGILISIYLAAITYVLTKRYGESKDQINRLDTLAIKQQTQVDTLVNILKELKIQNQYTKEENLELTSQGLEIFKQTQLIFEQLKINQQEQIISNQLSKLSKNSNRNIFRNAFYKIGDLWNVFLKGRHELDSISNIEKREFLNHLKPIVEGQFSNPYLLEDDILQKKWIRFNSDISNCENILNNSASVQVFDGTKSFIPDDRYLEKYKKNGLKYFIANTIIFISRP